MTINLLKISTLPPKGLDKKTIKAATAAYIEELNDLQNLLYAEGKHSLLIVLQGMDASGKGGAVRKVFSKVNPMGVRVQAFKAPTKKELSHDFLWRIHKHAPAKGMIQIFDRSHYEDVLITRVMGWCDEETAQQRFAHINAFERLLESNGTKILKFYLHVSEKEQQERFHERLTMPHKQWKFSDDDLEKAKQWPAYRKVYEDAITNCSPDIPWIIVPTDKNWYKEYIIAKTVVDTLKGLNMKFPKGEIDYQDPDTIALLQRDGDNDKK